MTRRTTTIKVETHEILVMRSQGSLVQSWCEQCGKPAGMLRVEEVALAGVNIETIWRKARTDQLHLIETTGGLVFMCLNSLLKEN